MSILNRNTVDDLDFVSLIKCVKLLEHVVFVEAEIKVTLVTSLKRCDYFAARSYRELGSPILSGTRVWLETWYMCMDGQPAFDLQERGTKNIITSSKLIIKVKGSYFCFKCILKKNRGNIF